MSKILSYKEEDVKFYQHPSFYKAQVQLNSGDYYNITVSHNMPIPPEEPPKEVDLIYHNNSYRIRLLNILRRSIEQLNKKRIDKLLYTKEDLLELRNSLLNNPRLSMIYSCDVIDEVFKQFIINKENYKYEK